MTAGRTSSLQGQMKGELSAAEGVNVGTGRRKQRTFQQTKPG